MLADRDRLLALYRERVTGYDADENFRDRWRAWCRLLLAHGGDLVVPPLHPEPDLDLLLAIGVLQETTVTALDLGGDCHANVANSWLDSRIAAIGTGYALHEDLWRQHSWGVSADGTIVETKSPHERYFGATLPPGESTVLFVLNSYPGDVKALLKTSGDRVREIIRVMQMVRQRLSKS
ncbi:hypothetical protein Rhe02_61430 [Rhizocola hellebori]|uniref:Uncharacterized protein n=1 Tax=Rhizocola hellebori TaxID=1392758 RepID=A0A8J3QF03_9ACTN|nr:hypothetical protein [Rhizocola hellebori]GIH08076.1 hypothetical protein Rhe02_61430 [Rhizocola hellebori]